MEHEKQNGVPRWVEERFDRLEADLGKVGDRVEKLEEKTVDFRVWQGKLMVWGVLGTVLLNGFVTLCIMLLVRRLSPG